ncbi:hypothetical protein [Edaphovirga cremea]|uniref:hypothetical protein n=1 Tax=Edaphovirga cremea TaxID=2267246 RepID=UPI001300B868|nr:hypothetical protein [Edaphovirga cremea]
MCRHITPLFFGIRGAVGLPTASWPTLVQNWLKALPLPASVDKWLQRDGFRQ